MEMRRDAFICHDFEFREGPATVTPLVTVRLRTAAYQYSQFIRQCPVLLMVRRRKITLRVEAWWMRVRDKIYHGR